MLAPISWLKEFVDIRLPLPKLMWKMTEAGLTTESFHKEGSEIILDVEVTPNRPDWLSILGLARDLAAIQQVKVTETVLSNIPSPTSHLLLTIRVDKKTCPRYTGIVIGDVKVADSPEWIKKRLKLVGLRPINNLVDITNYVMWERGVPIHVFDYDKFANKSLVMSQTEGGEKFTSVDGISYKLPKNTIIIKDGETVIDLCGIKGGENTGISPATRNIFIHVPIYQPQIIRKTSQALNLRSDASYIYERGANAGGTLDTLKRVVALTLELAGGKVASKIIDEKIAAFNPWRLELSLERLAKILGIEIPVKKVLEILTNLNLSPKLSGQKIICTIPTYRGDLKLEEDLIEEVARIYGYNNFPQTLPVGETRTKKVPYFFDDSFHLALKNLLAGSGYSEVMTFSLISGELIEKCLLPPTTHIKIANPVSAEYALLRTSLVPNLISAVKLNANEEKLKIFELGKVYLGQPSKTQESYKLAAAAKNITFREFKGIIDLLLKNISKYKINVGERENGLWHPVKSAQIVANSKILGMLGYLNPKVIQNLELPPDLLAVELDVELLNSSTPNAVFREIPKYPPQIEDITLQIPPQTKVGEVVQLIEISSNDIETVELKDIYQESYTFRILYQNPRKTLTDKEVEKIRNKIIKLLQTKFGVRVK